MILNCLFFNYKNPPAPILGRAAIKTSKLQPTTTDYLKSVVVALLMS